MLAQVLSQIDPTIIQQVASEVQKSAAGRSDAVWLAAIVMGGIFVIIGVLVHFGLLPYLKNTMEIDRKRAESEDKRAEAEDKRNEEMSKAVAALCEVAGKSHTLAVSTEQSVDRIERQLFHVLMWTRPATEALGLICESRDDIDPKLVAALGAMRGAISLIDVPHDTAPGSHPRRNQA